MKKNRLLALLLVNAMIFVFMPAAAFAYQEDSESCSNKSCQTECPSCEEPECESVSNADVVIDGVQVTDSLDDESAHTPESGEKGNESAEASAAPDTAEQKESDGDDVDLKAAEDSDWYLSRDEIEMYFDPDDYDPWILYAYGSDLDDVYVNSSNTNVVSIGDVTYEGYNDGEYEYRIELYRQGGGNATVTVYDENGDYRTCTITAEATPYGLNRTSFAFNKKDPYDAVWFWSNYWGKDREFVKAQSSNNKVATVRLSYGEALVTAKKSGKAIITVTDRSGKVTKLTITVSKGWRKANLKWSSGGTVYYSATKVYVSSKPKTKVTLKIGGKTFKKKTNKSGYCYINIKKHFKLNTKYSITYSKSGVKYVQKGKVQSNTWAEKTFT